MVNVGKYTIRGSCGNNIFQWKLEENQDFKSSLEIPVSAKYHKPLMVGGYDLPI